jgi:hypothetical protein
MPPDRADQPEREQALAERFKPLLLLYPEISSETRRVRTDWREEGLPPLYEDYHPRDVRLVLDHALIPGRTPLHDGDRLLEELERNPSAERIDLLAGTGHADRQKFWAEYFRIVNKEGQHQRDKAYPHSAYVHIAYGDDVAGTTSAGESASPCRGLIAIEYWLIYLYNDWRATHEGDWELIVVFLGEGSGSGGQNEPIACAYSAHHGGYRLPWRQVEKVDDQGQRADGGTHPAVYVANGSHANYFSGPRRYATTTEKFGVRITTGEFPFTGKFMDFTTSFDEGVRVFPNLKVVPTTVEGRWTGEWQWLNLRGQWGSLGVPKWLGGPLRVLPRRVRFKLFRRIWGAPASLPQRNNWTNPFAWVERECEEAPPWDDWLVRLNT